MTPTARTLALLRAEGYLAAVAEAWVPGVNRRRDPFGFADVTAWHPRLAGPLLAQVTAACHLAEAAATPRPPATRRVLGKKPARIDPYGNSRFFLLF